MKMWDGAADGGSLRVPLPVGIGDLNVDGTCVLCLSRLGVDCDRLIAPHWHRITRINYYSASYSPLPDVVL